MRLNVHDYSGHPFQVQLSRALARRGHTVVHEFSTQYVTGHGRLEVTPADPPTLRIEGVTAPCELRKYDAFARVRFEHGYARAWRSRLGRDAFDVVVACNVPLLALAEMRRHFERRRQPWVLWHQDIYSAGMAGELGRRLPPGLAGTGRLALELIERAQVRSARQVVAIHEDFARRYASWGLPTDHVSVIPNWAPLDEVTPGPRDNAWTREAGLPSAPLRLMYAGTLGRKHNPLLLLRLLDAVRARGVDAMLVVCSEGVGADSLAAAAAGRPDVRLLGYQPAERFAEVLAGADAMIALLEPDAAAFSVPSKVLTYLAAGRPILGLMPAANAAARDILAAGGYVADPTLAGACMVAEWLAGRVDPGLRQLAWLGKAARELAVRRFDIEAIADRFETVLAAAATQPAAALPVARPAPAVLAEDVA